MYGRLVGHGLHSAHVRSEKDPCPLMVTYKGLVMMMKNTVEEAPVSLLRQSSYSVLQPPAGLLLVPDGASHICREQHRVDPAQREVQVPLPQQRRPQLPDTGVL